MQVKNIFDQGKWPILIAGPCSAETEEQVMETARQLKSSKIDAFRAGVWKPRTRPDSFEGIGKDALPWLNKVQKQFGYRITTEVAQANHVELCLEANIDILWIGARTTVNPFSVQEIASALEGVDIPVMVKNPISPDLALWLGAFERLYKSGIRNMAAIHRGFSSLGQSKYRNKPQWQLALELKRHIPDIQLIVDPSHICGNRTLLHSVAQKALDLNYDGIMMESHINPDHAWSDAKQQIKPARYSEIIDQLILRNTDSRNAAFQTELHKLRNAIDEVDKELIHVLFERMNISEEIAQLKKNNNISIFQAERWNEVVDNALKEAAKLGLSTSFINNILRAIHEESINHQDHIMNVEWGE